MGIAAFEIFTFNNYGKQEYKDIYNYFFNFFPQ